MTDEWDRVRKLLRERQLDLMRRLASGEETEDQRLRREWFEQHPEELEAPRDEGRLEPGAPQSELEQRPHTTPRRVTDEEWEWIQRRRRARAEGREEGDDAP